MELGYRRNIAWQKNQQAIISTAELLDMLPVKTHYKKIADQLFASVSSVGANIAEGFSDFAGNEYQRYLKISLRSAFETDHWLTTMRALLNRSSGNLTELIEEINSLNIETIKILIKTIESIKKKRKESKEGV